MNSTTVLSFKTMYDRYMGDQKYQTTVGYETQGPSPSSRAESRARIFEFPIF